MNSLFKKIPWGIIAGICGVLAFYTLAGTIGALIAMNAITSIVEGAAGLFGTWWQTLLFSCAVIFSILFLCSLVMFILVKVGLFGKKVSKEEIENENA